MRHGRAYVPLPDHVCDMSLSCQARPGRTPCFPGPGPSVRSTLVGCVTLHAVIDENFTVTGFEPAVTQRASHYEACYVGKGISCASAVSGLGNAAAAAAVVAGAAAPPAPAAEPAAAAGPAAAAPAKRRKKRKRADPCKEIKGSIKQRAYYLYRARVEEFGFVSWLEQSDEVRRMFFEEATRRAAEDGAVVKAVAAPQPTVV